MEGTSWWGHRPQGSAGGVGAPGARRQVQLCCDSDVLVSEPPPPCPAFVLCVTMSTLGSVISFCLCPPNPPSPYPSVRSGLVLCRREGRGVPSGNLGLHLGAPAGRWGKVRRCLFPSGWGGVGWGGRCCRLPRVHVSPPQIQAAQTHSLRKKIPNPQSRGSKSLSLTSSASGGPTGEVT